MNKRKMGLLVILAMLMCLGMSISAFAATDGWSTDGKYRYYYQDGAKLRGWQKIEGKKYYFAAKGRMAYGYYKVGKKTYRFRNDGVCAERVKRAKWVLDAKGRRYDKGNGTYLTGWKVIQFKRYRFDKHGYAVTGWKKVKGEWYYFNAKGVMQTSKLVKTGDDTYYVGADGKRVMSLWVDNYYFGADGKWIKGYIDQTRNSETKTGWVGYGRYMKYYVNGVAKTGWKTIEGNRYYFQSDGYIRIGWFNNGKFYYYLSTDQKHLGKMSTGWLKIDGKYYFFFTKKTKVGGTTYKKGTMARGIGLRSSSTGKTYYFNESGVCTNYSGS